jgi:UDP-4-amino-4,6-dideoxy-N-acetyl-beta-L-altrosamine transaminase
MIPYGKQDINQDDIDAVVDVLKSDFLTQGPQVPKFEESVSNYCNANYAVAVNSATSALHLACLALGLGKSDWLWTSPNTFVASANCGIYCGAQVDFVDINSDTYNMCAELLEQKLIVAERNNKLPKVVLPVHFAGQSCDMKRIHSLSKKYGFKIIEDASHAIGAKYLDEQIGNCKYSDVTIFSFHPVKIITTAEGGLAITNKVEIAETMQRLRSHGITRDSKLMDQEPDGEWYYQQLDLGYNYRITEIQAALGYSQLSRLDEYVQTRNELALYYDEALEKLPLHTPIRNQDCYSSFHLYVIRLKLDEISISHKNAFSKLRERGVGVNLHYIPVHLQPYYRDMGFQFGDFPESEKYYSEAMSIPLYPTMGRYRQDEIIKALREELV